MKVCKDLGKRKFITVIFATVEKWATTYVSNYKGLAEKLCAVGMMPNLKPRRGHQRKKNVEIHEMTWKDIYDILN